MSTNDKPAAGAAAFDVDFNLSAATLRLQQAQRTGVNLDLRMQMVAQALDHVNQAHRALFPAQTRRPEALPTDGAEYQRGR